MWKSFKKSLDQIGLVKTESHFIVRSVQTGLGIVRTPPFLKGVMDFLRIGQKGGGDSIFFFNKGRDRKKGWDGVIRGEGVKKIYKTFSISLKETQSFKAY